MNKNTRDKIILSEATGVSIAVVIALVSAVYYIGGVASDVRANSFRISARDKTSDSFKRTYIEHTRMVDKNFKDLNRDTGFIKGQLEILVKRKQ